MKSSVSRQGASRGRRHGCSFLPGTPGPCSVSPRRGSRACPARHRAAHRGLRGLRKPVQMLDRLPDPVISALRRGGELYPSSAAIAPRSESSLFSSGSSPGSGSFSFLAPAAQPDELGQLGHYRVLKLLGRGGMGMVFLAEDSQSAPPGRPEGAEAGPGRRPGAAAALSCARHARPQPCGTTTSSPSTRLASKAMFHSWPWNTCTARRSAPGWTAALGRRWRRSSASAAKSPTAYRRRTKPG